jgi:MFS family permease
VSALLARSLRSLAIPNYRRYFVGQIVSLTGSWTETIAETWLVFQLTHSGLALGIAAALQWIPLLLAGAWGGLVADRLPRRQLLMVTQTLLALPALALFALVVTGAIELWMVYALLLARGVVGVVDNPARQAFLVELVGPEHLLNAVGLTSAIVNASRTVGPALAGVLIATVGVAPCFVINAASFLALILALHGMDAAALVPVPRAERAAGQVRSGLRYVRATPQLWITLCLVAVCTTFAFNFQVLLPLLATFSLHGGASSYATLATAMGLGAVGGAVSNGTRTHIRPTLLIGAVLVFGMLSLVVSVAPSVALAAAVLIPVGAAWVVFATGARSALQLAVVPEMRGRVMALFSIVAFGSMPIGAPLMGWIANATGPRPALALGGAAAILSAIAARIAFVRTGVPTHVAIGVGEAPA